LNRNISTIKMYNNRFKVAKWVNQHQFDASDWRSVNPSIMNRIKNGLVKFRTKSPIITIAIPAWNEEKNLLNTLSSFAAMNVPYPTELLIINNNSSDGTEELLKEIGIRYINETKQGIAHARLAGLNAAKGKIHLCGDSDSLYPPNWIKSMTKDLMENNKIKCVYGNYSFLPSEGFKRPFLGFYELMAETMFEIRRISREYLNVRGANFAFRTAEGIAAKGFEMKITRTKDNDSKNYVVFGEDGRMGRKLGETGKLKLIHSYKARIWTSSRRLAKDGSFFGAFSKRIKHESLKLIEYVFGTFKPVQTTDTI